MAFAGTLYKIENPQKEIRKTISRLKKASRKTSSILRAALNDTAFDAMHAERKTMPFYIHMPTPYTISGIQVNKATSKNKMLHAEVFLEETRWKYLQHIITGKTRRGGSWGTPRLIVPAFGRNLNKHGNFGKKKLQSMIARTKGGLRINNIYPSDYTKKTVNAFFFGIPHSKQGDKDALGYYLWSKGKLLMQYAVRDQVSYDKEYPIFKAADKTAKRVFRKRFEEKVIFFRSRGWI